MGAIVFVHGVASGDPTTDGVVLQTCAQGDAGDVELTWWVALDDAPDAVVASGTATATEAADHTARAVVDGLTPGTAHRYGFVAADGTRSPVGRFRTLPVEPDRFRFAVVACAKHNAGFFNALGRVAARDDLDVVLHLGDYIYEAANTPPASQTPGADIGRDMEPLEECRRLDQYRARYRQYRRDPDLQALHAAHAVVAIIDDHELADNAWSGGAQEHREDRDGPWARRMAEALQAWNEWVPSRVDRSAGQLISRGIDLGSLARISLLETRTTRGAPGSDRELLGEVQRGWLAEQLTIQPPPYWQVLAPASPLCRFWAPELSELSVAAGRQLKILDPGSGGPNTDRWDGFATERDRILDQLAGLPSGRLLLDGDVHVGLHTELRTSDGRLAAVEATTPSISSQNLDDKMGWPRGGSREHAAALRSDLPHIRWCDLDSHGYLVVELTRDRATVEWWGVDEVLTRGDGESLLHRVELAPADTGAP